MTTYFRDRHQGVGAIAAAAPAPRSAPAPTISRRGATFSRTARQGDPMLNLPRQVRFGVAHEVLPGVVVRSASLVRPAVLMSGVRPGQPPGGGYGRTGTGAINIEETGHPGGRVGPGPDGGGGGGGRGARLSARASTMGMKPGAYVPPVAPLMTTVVSVRRSPTGIQTFQIGTGIGQAGGAVAGAQPSPYGPGLSSPTAQIGTGVSINPVLEEYSAPVDVGVQTPIEPTLVSATPPPRPGLSTNTWLLLGGGALALYLLTRKRKRKNR